MIIDYRPWTIIAVHLPATRGPLSFVPWEAFWTQQAELARRPTMIIGDWNSGAALDRQSKKRFTVEKHFQALSAEYQWTDLWRLVHGRSQEYTWFSRAGNGFRVDHCFISPAGRELITTADCYYDHRFRDSGASDHSALCVELGWEG
jgi:exonuclease III